jgi:hypothetical protein
MGMLRANTGALRTLTWFSITSSSCGRASRWTRNHTRQADLIRHRPSPASAQRTMSMREDEADVRDTLSSPV